MIAGNYESPLMCPTGQLNTVSRSGCIPTPAIAFHLFCNVYGLGPRFSIVLARCNEHISVVTCEWKPDYPSLPVDNRAGIPNRYIRVTPFFVNELCGHPRFAPINTSTQKHVQIAMVIAIVLATFAKDKQRPLVCGDDRRNSIRMVVVLTACKEIL